MIVTTASWLEVSDGGQLVGELTIKIYCSLTQPSEELNSQSSEDEEKKEEE